MIFSNEGSREASFVNAIAAASMTHNIVRGCADGSLRDCRCDRQLVDRSVPEIPSWKWSGCSADLQQPIRLNRKFMDGVRSERIKKNSHLKDYIDRHNHMAGRLVCCCCCC